MTSAIDELLEYLRGRMENIRDCAARSPHLNEAAHLRADAYVRWIAAVEELVVFEDLDQNYVVCEACQRYTLPKDMMVEADCCCRWCGRLDALEALRGPDGE